MAFSSVAFPSSYCAAFPRVRSHASNVGTGTRNDNHQ